MGQPVSGRAYPAILGLVVGALLVGVVLPFSFSGPDRAVVRAGSGPSSEGGGSVEAGPDGSLRSDDAVSSTGDVAGPRAAVSSASTLPERPQTAADQAASGASAPAGEPVRIGFVLIDLGGSGGLGFDFGLDPRQQERAIRAGVADLNERGGLAGHPIEPRFATFNVLDTFTSGGDSGRQVCIKLTEDDKVFAVVGYLFPKDQLCVAKEQGTLMLSDAANNLDSSFAEAEGRLLSIYPRSGRMMAAKVQFLDAAGFLRDRKVGIVGEVNNDPQGEVANALAAELRRAGHTVTRLTRLAGDLSQGASQMPVEVSQHRSAGTDLVLFLVNPLYVQQFAQQAESQGWTPRYGFSDWANGTADGANDMPSSLDGALGVTGHIPGGGTKDFTGFDEQPAAAACRQNYERRTGEKLPARGSGDNKYSITLLACDDLRILQAIAAVAGPGFDRDAFVAAVERVGTLDGMASNPPGSFGPGKRDFRDFARLQVWDADCDCFHPQGPFRRTP